MKILTNKQYKNLTDETEQLKLANKNLATENGKKTKEFNSFRKGQEVLLEFKDLEIQKVQSIIEEKDCIIKKLEQEVEQFNQFLNEREIRINSLNDTIKKQNNKIDAQQQVIKEYEMAIDKLESQNKIQVDKIKELSSQVPHSKIEYANNGLPKQTKEKLKKGNEKK